MIKLTSASQAKQLRGKIPELAIMRMTQLEGTDGLYDPTVDGKCCLSFKWTEPLNNPII